MYKVTVKRMEENGKWKLVAPARQFPNETLAFKDFLAKVAIHCTSSIALLTPISITVSDHGKTVATYSIR